MEKKNQLEDVSETGLPGMNFDMLMLRMKLNLIEIVAINVVTSVTIQRSL